MPVKASLKFMASVGSNLLNAEREFLNDVVDKIDGIFLRMAVIDFQCSYARCIIDRRILVTLDFLALIPFKNQEFNIHLDVVAWNLLAVALRVDRSLTGLASDPPPIIQSRFRLVVNQNHGSDRGGIAWQDSGAVRSRLSGC